MGAEAHRQAIDAVAAVNPVMSKADFEAIDAAVGRMNASVPESADAIGDAAKHISGDPTIS